MRVPPLIAVLLLALVGVQAACTSPARTTDTVPANAGFSLATKQAIDGLSISEFVRLGCSEKVSVYTQTTPYTGANSSIPGQALAPARFQAGSWPRENCPHLASGLTPFESDFPTLTAESTITIVAGKSLLLRGCALTSAAGIILKRVIIESGATLVLDDSPLELHVREIVVAAGGKLLAGSESCRLFSPIKIVLHGSASDSNLPDDAGSVGKPSKGLIVNGQIDVHGKEYFPTWTRLARTAGRKSDNDSLLFLQEAVNWEVGQQVLITTSVLLDCPDHLAASWCKPCWDWQTCEPQKHQNEVRTIVALGQSPHLPNSGHPSLFSALQLDQPLQYEHYAGSEYQSEVALLSRRIEFVGEESNDDFGGHIQVASSSGEGRFSGVRGENLGQVNRLGRYPFHLHMLGDGANAARSYISDCSVTNSNFRAFVVHGSNRTRLSRNVGFNVTGMAVYLEDGVEELNLIEYNLMAHVHPIFRPANGGWGQGGETFLAQSGLLIPADTSASGFYSLNAHNSYIGNAASGGWSGFVFPNAPTPVGDYKTGLPPGHPSNPWQPMNRPLLRFVGNTVHSVGYHWVEHGSAIYVGAWFDYSGTTLRYNSGRNNRNSRNPDGSHAIDVFTDTKVWLSNKGIAHWGNAARIEGAELHDIRVSAMLFGSASMVNVLVNGGSPNLGDDWVVNRDKMGFQFYVRYENECAMQDTWVQTILSGVTFRNYSSTKGQFAVRYMDHSDHYTPQGINAVRGIVWDNVDENARLGIANCGAACGGERSTMSSRIYSVWDWDGSLSSSAGASILGSSLDWFNSPEHGCVLRENLKVWVCNWHERSSVAFIGPTVNGLNGGCDSSVATGCTDQFAPYSVGSVSQFGGAVGRARSVDLAPWPGVAGLSNTGWYWRTKSTPYGVDGAPSEFIIDNTMQLGRNQFVVLAVAYPASTTFSVRIESVWWRDGSNNPYRYPVAAATTLATVLTPREELNDPDTFTCDSGNWWGMCTNTGGTGPTYFFDGTHLYLRVVSPACYTDNQKQECYDAVYSSGGIGIPNIMGGFKYVVTATCSGCAVQSSRNGITFWSTPDVAPAARFPTDLGAIRSNPPTPPAELVTQPTCSLPDTATVDGDGSGKGLGGGAAHGQPLWSLVASMAGLAAWSAWRA